MKKYWEKKASKSFKKKLAKMGSPKSKVPEVKASKSYMKVKSKRPAITARYRKGKYMSGKRGQMFIIGIFMLIIAMIIFIATLPAISQLVNNVKGCDSLNCAGYVDKDSSAAQTTCAATNKTYISSLQTDTLGCTIIDLFVPFLILGVLMAGIIKLIYDKLHREPTEAPPMYGGGY